MTQQHPVVETLTARQVEASVLVVREILFMPSNGPQIKGPKPVVTGSRGGNVALGSLITGLAGLGLITDNSSA